jgi:hypothetical protein
MIISLRGTNGSGKSTVVRELMDAGKVSPIHGALGVRNPEAYRVLLPGVKQPLYVLGPYNVECGGCDRIIPYDLIIALIDKYAARGNVLFEGVIVASVYGRVGEQLERYRDRAVVAYLPTTLEECIARVQKRRDERGDARPFNPRNLTSKYKTIARWRERMIEEGKLKVIDLPSTGAAKVLLELLRDGGQKTKKDCATPRANKRRA